MKLFYEIIRAYWAWAKKMRILFLFSIFMGPTTKNLFDFIFIFSFHFQYLKKKDLNSKTEYNFLVFLLLWQHCFFILTNEHCLKLYVYQMEGVEKHDDRASHTYQLRIVRHCRVYEHTKYSTTSCHEDIILHSFVFHLVGLSTTACS